MLSATSDFAVVAGLDTINICVPTPLRKTKDPDMSYIVSAVEQIAQHLHPGMLIILESTTYPGTTEELVQPMLEAGGLKAGVDFFLAFSPERVDPGNPTFNTHNVPKVVGGVGARVDASWRRALRRGDRDHRAGQLAAGGRDGQAAREHLPHGQHRAGERNRADVRSPRPRRLGSREGGRDQAVRVHAVLSGPRPRRSLHPDRSVLPLVEGQADRLRSALHRAGRPDQRQHAAVRRRQDRAMR